MFDQLKEYINAIASKENKKAVEGADMKIQELLH
jgi:hypothetical protein